MCRRQDLFKKVVPYHCLGGIWSQRDKKGKEHLAPTIRATVAQFNSVTNCVITTCLSNPTLKANQRARLLERWIDVARVSCRQRSSSCRRGAEQRAGVVSRKKEIEKKKHTGHVLYGFLTLVCVCFPSRSVGS